MKSIAILPLRSGSKGIPGKNKKKLLGRPLYQWVLGEAIFSDLDYIYVFTDDDEILSQVKIEYSWTQKVIGIKRSDESATNTASTEMAMLELAKIINYDFDVFCLMQATTPLTSTNDINLCLKMVKEGEHDSAMTVVRTHRFIWAENGESLNYDYRNRPRRQDFGGLLIENGAIYVVTKDSFQMNKNRLGDRIGIVEMADDTFLEIDEPSDWLVAEGLVKNRLLLKKKPISEIKIMVFDVDGVFTDGTLGTSNDGELFKQFSVRDGMGFEYLKQTGITPIVITSEDSNIVKSRMKKLKINNLYSGVKDKYSRLENILKRLGVARNQVAYVGDDVNDLANLCSVAWGIAPSNALDLVKMNVDIVLNNPGGNLCIREAIDFIEKYNKKF